MYIDIYNLYIYIYNIYIYTYIYRSFELDLNKRQGEKD